MRRPRRLLAFGLVSIVWLAQAAPAFALLGWSASGSQTPVQAGQSVVVTYTVSNDNLLSLLGIDDIGCVHVDVGASFEIGSVTIIDTPGNRIWRTDQSGSVAIAHSDSGGGRLGVGQSVTFSITALAEAAGSFSWSTRVKRDQDCDGAYITGSETEIVAVAAAPTPTPSPTPSPTPKPTTKPTPQPTPKPTPSPSPTPLLPLPSLPLPLPSLGLPSLNGSPAPTASSSPGASPSARAAMPAASPTGSPDAGEESPQRPSVSPSVAASPAGSPSAAPGGVEVGGGPPDGGSAAGRPGPAFAFPINEETGEIGVEVGGLDLFADPVWAFPAATIAGPGLLVLLWLLFQAVGAAAWIPAVRRLRGEDRSVR